jgi:hypothetical protein
MAEDRKLGNDIYTSDYARIDRPEYGGGRVIQVRGTQYPAPGEREWSSNRFSPEEARELARYLIDLADDAEIDPEADALTEFINGVMVFPNGTADARRIAEKLARAGWHK